MNKKIIIPVLLAALLIGLSGCTQEGTTGEAFKASGGAVPPAPAPLSITDSITFDEYMFSTPIGGVPQIEFDEIMDHNHLDYLADWPSKSYTFNGVTYYSTMNERIAITADSLFDYQGENEVITEIGTGDYKYNLNFSNGLPGNFYAGDGNSIQVPFLYETCDVLEISEYGGSSGMVKLRGRVSGKTYTMYDSQGFPYNQ
ncbi:hypothetical protein KJ660_03220, partial [Candidatus Micrarchaeota archaeon]|nr:hypothetical protein [Candidatus Micrarchaeota archaeon]